MLKSDEGWGDAEIADEVGISIPTVRRVRYNFVKRGLMGAIYHKQQNREHVQKIQGKWKAQLIQLINSKPPEGYARWNLRVLTEAYNQLEGEGFKKVSHETMRQTLIRFGIRLEEE